MDLKHIREQSGSQKEINKLFLKACKTDDIEAVKYLLTSKELMLKAQLNISKQTGYANEEKEGFIPLILAVQHNSKKVYQYFLEEIDWFSKLTYEAQLEVLAKGTYTNDVDTIKYLFEKFEMAGKVSSYHKPYALSKILEAVIDKNSDKVFDYLMTLPKEYLEHFNTKYDQSFIRAAKSSNKILLQMLDTPIYKDLSVELYLTAFGSTKNNPQTSLTLFKYGIEKNMYDIWLTKKASSYVRDKVRDFVFKTFNDSVINYIYEEQTKLSYPQRLIELANENIRDYFFTEDEAHKYKNNQSVAPVLEYVIKNKLLNKEIKQQIVFDIVNHEYKNLLDIISQYPIYGEDIDLNKSFIECVHKNSIGKEKYKKLQQILDLDTNKKIIIWADDFAFFKNLENIKRFGQDYDQVVKKVFTEYEFWPDEKLKMIYKNNSEMLKLVEMKKLNMKLSEKEHTQQEIKTKKNKI